MKPGIKDAPYCLPFKTEAKTTLLTKESSGVQWSAS